MIIVWLFYFWFTIIKMALYFPEFDCFETF